jgi:hypothetical protein
MKDNRCLTQLFFNSVNFASVGRQFHSTAPLYPKLFFKYSVFGLGTGRLVLALLRL